MLIGNYSVLNKTPGRWLGGGGVAHASGIGSAQPSMRCNFNANGSRRNAHYAEGTAALKRIGYPVGGYGPLAWMMPYTAGDLASHNETQGSVTVTLSLASGWNIAGQTDGSSTADATLQLVVSMVGTAAGLATVTGNILAALGMSGSAAGTSTASAEKNAIAWCAGSAAGVATGSLTSYATGQLVGTTEESGLTVAGITNSVWNALLANYGVDGSAGKALGTASSGGVDYEALAAAILAAAQTTPIHADVQKVNSYDVTGTGAVGNEWGPA